MNGLEKVLQRLALINSENTNKSLYEVSDLIFNNMKNFSPNTLKKLSDLQEKVIDSMTKGDDYNRHVKKMKSVINKSLKRRNNISLS